MYNMLWTQIHDSSHTENLSRYASGDIEYCLRKTRLKKDSELYPACHAISSTDSRVDSSSADAYWIRLYCTYCE